MKVEQNKLQIGLKTMQRLAQPEVVNITVKDNFLILKGAGESSACRIKVEVEDADDCQEQEITVDLALLTNITDKCKNLELTIEGSTIKVKDKSYEADIIGLEDQPITIIPSEVLKGEGGILLGNKFMNEMLKVLPKLELRPLLSTYSEVPIGIKATKNGTFVACFDFIQTAFVKLDDVKGDFEFILPSVSQFSNLAKEFSGQKYKLVITDTTLYAFNNEIHAALALPQTEGEQLKLEDVIGLVKQLEDVKYQKLIFDAEAVKKFLVNSRYVYDKDSVFTVKVVGSKATIDLKATVGNTQLKTKLMKEVKDLEFKCDLNFFSSIINKGKGKQIHLKVTPELMKITDGDVNYLMSLI